MLDEVALRKPGFQEGQRIKLADCQEWSFPKPRLRFKPKLVDGKVEVGGGPTFGPEFDDKMDALLGIREVPPAEWVRLRFEMALRLLMANYTLPADDLADLLVMETGDPASDEMWGSLERLMMGLPPKPSPAT